jgi:hypothetical protein
MTRLYRAAAPSERLYGAERFGQPILRLRGVADRAL